MSNLSPYVPSGTFSTLVPSSRNFCSSLSPTSPSSPLPTAPSPSLPTHSDDDIPPILVLCRTAHNQLVLSTGLILLDCLSLDTPARARTFWNDSPWTCHETGELSLPGLIQLAQIHLIAFSHDVSSGSLSTPFFFNSFPSQLASFQASPTARDPPSVSQPPAHSASASSSSSQQLSHHNPTSLSSPVTPSSILSPSSGVVGGAAYSVSSPPPPSTTDPSASLLSFLPNGVSYHPPALVSQYDDDQPLFTNSDAIASPVGISPSTAIHHNSAALTSSITPPVGSVGSTPAGTADPSASFAQRTTAAPLASPHSSNTSMINHPTTDLFPLPQIQVLIDSLSLQFASQSAVYRPSIETMTRLLTPKYSFFDIISSLLSNPAMYQHSAFFSAAVGWACSFPCALPTLLHLRDPREISASDPSTTATAVSLFSRLTAKSQSYTSVPISIPAALVPFSRSLRLLPHASTLSSSTSPLLASSVAGQTSSLTTAMAAATATTVTTAGGSTTTGSVLLPFPTFNPLYYVSYPHNTFIALAYTAQLLQSYTDINLVSSSCSFFSETAFVAVLHELLASPSRITAFPTNMRSLYELSWVQRLAQFDLTTFIVRISQLSWISPQNRALLIFTAIIHLSRLIDDRIPLITFLPLQICEHISLVPSDIPRREVLFFMYDSEVLNRDDLRMFQEQQQRYEQQQQEELKRRQAATLAAAAHRGGDHPDLDLDDFDDDLDDNDEDPDGDDDGDDDDDNGHLADGHGSAETMNNPSQTPRAGRPSSTPKKAPLVSSTATTTALATITPTTPKQHKSSRARRLQRRLLGGSLAEYRSQAFNQVSNRLFRSRKSAQHRRRLEIEAEFGEHGAAVAAVSSGAGVVDNGGSGHAPAVVTLYNPDDDDFMDENGFIDENSHVPVTWFAAAHNMRDRIGSVASSDSHLSPEATSKQTAYLRAGLPQSYVQSLTEADLEQQQQQQQQRQQRRPFSALSSSTSSVHSTSTPSHQATTPMTGSNHHVMVSFPKRPSIVVYDAQNDTKLAPQFTLSTCDGDHPPPSSDNNSNHVPTQRQLRPGTAAELTITTTQPQQLSSGSEFCPQSLVAPNYPPQLISRRPGTASSSSRTTRPISAAVPSPLTTSEALLLAAGHNDPLLREAWLETTSMQSGSQQQSQQQQQQSATTGTAVEQHGTPAPIIEGYDDFCPPNLEPPTPVLLDAEAPQPDDSLSFPYQPGGDAFSYQPEYLFEPSPLYRDGDGDGTLYQLDAGDYFADQATPSSAYQLPITALSPNNSIHDYYCNMALAHHNGYAPYNPYVEQQPQQQPQQQQQPPPTSSLQLTEQPTTAQLTTKQSQPNQQQPPQQQQMQQLPHLSTPQGKAAAVVTRADHPRSISRLPSIELSLPLSDPLSRDAQYDDADDDGNGNLDRTQMTPIDRSLVQYNCATTSPSTMMPLIEDIKEELPLLTALPAPQIPTQQHQPPQPQQPQTQQPQQTQQTPKPTTFLESIDLYLSDEFKSSDVAPSLPQSTPPRLLDKQQRQQQQQQSSNHNTVPAPNLSKKSQSKRQQGSSRARQHTDIYGVRSFDFSSSSSSDLSGSDDDTIDDLNNLQTTTPKRQQQQQQQQQQQHQQSVPPQNPTQISFDLIDSSLHLGTMPSTPRAHGSESDFSLIDASPRVVASPASSLDDQSEFLSTTAVSPQATTLFLNRLENTSHIGLSSPPTSTKTLVTTASLPVSVSIASTSTTIHDLSTVLPPTTTTTATTTTSSSNNNEPPMEDVGDMQQQTNAVVPPSQSLTLLQVYFPTHATFLQQFHIIVANCIEVISDPQDISICLSTIMANLLLSPFTITQLLPIFHTLFHLVESFYRSHLKQRQIKPLFRSRVDEWVCRPLLIAFLIILQDDDQVRRTGDLIVTHSLTAASSSLSSPLSEAQVFTTIDSAAGNGDNDDEVVSQLPVNPLEILHPHLSRTWLDRLIHVNSPAASPFHLYTGAPLVPSTTTTTTTTATTTMTPTATPNDKNTTTIQLSDQHSVSVTVCSPHIQRDSLCHPQLRFYLDIFYEIVPSLFPYICRTYNILLPPPYDQNYT